MGRWSQYRKRGSVGPVVETGIPAPTDDQWHLTTEEGGEVIAVFDSGPDEAVRWFAQFTAGDIGSPALPWQDDSADATPAPLDIGPFALQRIWVRVQWRAGDDNPISDFSTPQFIDVA